jgi:hypothetical protein
MTRTIEQHAGFTASVNVVLDLYIDPENTPPPPVRPRR